MAGLKKARKLAAQKAAENAAKQTKPTQNYYRASTPRAPKAPPLNQLVMTTGDMPSETDK